MTVVPTSRLNDALRRYGRAARLVRTPPATIRILVSDLSPLKHSDLPADGISAEGLVLLDAGNSAPREGERIVDGEIVWLVRSTVPVEPDAPAARARLYRLQLANHAGGSL